MSKTKILVVGIGGVGGYFGGLLAKEYQKSNDVEVYFLSRGKNLDKIKSEGLKVVDNEKEFKAHPHIISDNAHDFGFVDYVFLCTKTYSLSETIEQISPSVSDKTVLIPFQNGVNSRAIISETYSTNLITHGCVYLISRLEEPGLIIKKGQVGSLFFGLNNIHDNRLDSLQEILVKAAIKSALATDIDKVTWEKFIFLSSIATATTYFDANIHEILGDPHKLESLKKLIQEVTKLAHNKAIKIEGNQLERVLGILSSLPKGATASMHTDFKKQTGKTELESLTGYVVKEGMLNHVSVPTFEKMYRGIKETTNYTA